MKQNIGKDDRTIRLDFAVILASLYFMGAVNGVIASILITLAITCGFTSAIGICPFYLLLGLDTYSVNNEKNA